jgi:prevent-host-death family protein
MARELDLDEARPALSALVDELLAGGEPVALMRDGKPAVVIVSWEDYDLLVGAVQHLSKEWAGEVGL